MPLPQLICISLECLTMPDSQPRQRVLMVDVLLEGLHPLSTYCSMFAFPFLSLSLLAPDSCLASVLRLHHLQLPGCDKRIPAESIGPRLALQENAIEPGICLTVVLCDLILVEQVAQLMQPAFPFCLVA